MQSPSSLLAIVQILWAWPMVEPYLVSSSTVLHKQELHSYYCDILRVLWTEDALGYQSYIFCIEPILFLYFCDNWHSVDNKENNIISCCVQKYCRNLDWRKFWDGETLAWSLSWSLSHGDSPRFSSIMRWTSSATVTPSSLARICSHFICGAVKAIERLWVLMLYYMAPHYSFFNRS